MLEEFLKLFRLMPFVVVSYFLISGLIDANFKAFLVFMGLLISMLVTAGISRMTSVTNAIYKSTSGDALGNSQIPELIKTFNIFNLSSTPFSFMPLSINIYSFLLSYYSYVFFAYDFSKGMKKNTKDRRKMGTRNGFIIAILILLLLLDAVYLFNANKQYNPAAIIGMPTLLGAVFGCVWAIIIGRKNWSVPSKNTNAKCAPSEMQYSCKLNTNGDLIK